MTSPNTTFTKALGSQYQLRLTLNELSYDAVDNTSEVAWDLRLRKLAGTGYSTGNSCPWSVVFGATTIASSSLAGYNFVGVTEILLGSGTRTVGHAADGSLTLGAAGVFTDGGNNSPAIEDGTVVAQYPLTTLTRVPGTPTSITAAYVSDTQVAVGWAHNNASNGQPASIQIRTSVNGAAYSQVASISPATSVTVASAENQKVLAQVRETNSAGSSAWSVASPAVYTTPAPPTSVVAAKDASLNVVVSWSPQVAFIEHQHIVEHGTVTGGVTTWDGAVLATVAAGTSAYTHTAPDAGSQHVYRIFAKNTGTGTLTSVKVTSNTVQLLAAPNKPTMPALGPFVDKAKAFVVPWNHNPVDTTPQTAYELGYSTDGGATWSTTGKVTSTTPSKTFSASTYAADVALTVRVRTWGQATTGGSEGTGASPWSDLSTVTFKTRPVVTIISPANAGTYTKSALTVQLGFNQAELATFVNATISLYDATPTLLETLVSSTQASTVLGSSVANGASYAVKVTVIDSNGLVSDEVTSTFDVAYTLPVPAVVTATYLPDSGIGQLDITIAAPGAEQVAATLVTITRTIDGVVETVVAEYPKDASFTILDMTPTINGTNDYTVTTISVDGATADTLVSMVTAEPFWAFLSSGSGFSTIISFKANLQFGSNPTRSFGLVEASGRSRPIALFGESGTLEVSGAVQLLDNMGSTPQEVEAFILTSRIVCYRDPSGRRMFGVLTGALDSPSSHASGFQFKVSEAS